MADPKRDPIGDWRDTDDHLLTRARMVREASIKWAPPVRDWPVLHSILLKAPKHPGDQWLAVFKANGPDGPIVAFHKARTLMGALANGLSRVYTGKLSWKLETPYRPPRG